MRRYADDCCDLTPGVGTPMTMGGRLPVDESGARVHGHVRSK